MESKNVLKQTQQSNEILMSNKIQSYCMNVYYLNSNILYTHSMIRQKSLCTIKETVKDKPIISRNPSLKHISMENSHKKYMPLEAHSKRQPNQKIKKDQKNLNFSKDKIKSKGQSKQQKPISKRKKSQYLKPNIKQDQTGIGCMQMKKQLKLLVSKNTSKNIPKSSQQAQFLKKIQNFRQNRKKSQKQHKVKTNASLSQRSAHNIKQQKQKLKKGISPQNSSKKLQPQSLNASKHIQGNENHKYHFGLKNTRFSLQSNPLGVQKSQIEQALLNKHKRQQNHQKKEEKNNFLDIFKKYKKSFDIETIKFEKSMKNHDNVNSKFMQSNCISQLSLMDKISKSNSQNIMLNKSQTPPIKQQHQNTQEIVNLNQFKIKQSQSLTNQQSQEFVKLKINNKIVKKIDINIAPQKPNHYFTQDKTYGIHIMQNSQQNNNDQQNVEIKQEKIVQFQLYQEQSTVQQHPSERSNKNKQNITSQPNDHELQLNNKFQASKYYVQPIPAFKQKTSSNIQFQSPILNKDYQDNSLLGCQIALIEKNIVLDQQELQL